MGDSEEIVHKGKGINENKIEYSSKNEGLNVICIIIEELLHRTLELQDYLKEKNLKVLCLTETKLKEENQIVINNN